MSAARRACATAGLAAFARPRATFVRRRRRPRSDSDDDDDDDAAAGAGAGAASGSGAAKRAPVTETVRMRRGNMYVFKPEKEQALQSGRLYFDPAARYYWVYAGNPFWQRVKLGLLAVAILLFCLYPLWPTAMRVVVWYIAVILLLAILGFTVVQLTVFAVVWVFGYEFWLLPNLWSDEPVWELLKPTYTFKKSGPGALWMRLGVVALLGAVGYYFATAPPGELDLFLDQQKQFVNDLYAGTLLTDGSTQGKGGGAAKDRYAGMGYGKRHGGVQVPDISEVRAQCATCAGRCSRAPAAFPPTPAPRRCSPRRPAV